MTDDHITLPRLQFEELLESAATRGAQKAMASVGLGDEEAARDVQEMRGIVSAYRIVRRSMLQKLTEMLVLIAVGFVVAGISIKLKLFGGGS